MTAQNTTRLTIRLSAVLRGKLAEEAGDYGKLSTVARVILERALLTRTKKVTR